MPHYYRIGVIIELGIPLKKLEGLSEKRQLNLFRKTLQGYIDNLAELGGYQIITAIDNQNVLGHVIFSEYSYCFINDFDYSGTNKVALNTEHKVLRYFGTSFIVKGETEITDTIFNLRGVKKIKNKNLINIYLGSYQELKERNTGYTYS
jgi:hypothetical protein